MAVLLLLLIILIYLKQKTIIFIKVHANNATTICLYYKVYVYIELTLRHNIQQLIIINCNVVQVMVLNQTVYVSYTCY